MCLRLGPSPIGSHSFCGVCFPSSQMSLSLLLSLTPASGNFAISTLKVPITAESLVLPLLFWFEVSLFIWKLPWLFLTAWKGRGTSVEENCAPQLIENPSQSGFNSSCKRAPTPCVPQALAFLASVPLGKPSKLNQKSSLRRGPVASFAALLLKFQEGHSDNKKHPQLLVKLMSCCCPFRETLISSQRAGARGAQLHSLTALQPPPEPAAELPEQGEPFPCCALGSFVPGTFQIPSQVLEKRHKKNIPATKASQRSWPVLHILLNQPRWLAFWNYCRTRGFFARWGDYQVCGVFSADFKWCSVVNLRSHLRAQHKTCIRKYLPGDPLRGMMCLNNICSASGGAERQKCHWFPLSAFTNTSEMVLSPQEPLLS